MLKTKKLSLLALLTLLLALTITPIIGTYATTIPPGEEVIPPSQLPEPTQGNANVIVGESVGGTTDPAAGVHQYENGTVIELTATPQDGFMFLYWIIEGGYTNTDNLPPIYFTEDDDPRLAPPRPAAEVTAGDRLVLSQNPLVVLCGYGWSFQYQAVFVPETTFTQSVDATVTILSSVGGTTDPAPGTYSFEEDTPYTISATATTGYEFQYWVVSGDYLPGHGVSDQPDLDSVVIADNPLDVSCGYGYQYTYNPRFIPVGVDIPGETPDGGTTGIAEETFYLVVIALVAVIIIVLIFAVYSMRKRR